MSATPPDILAGLIAALAASLGYGVATVLQSVGVRRFVAAATGTLSHRL